MKLVLVVLSIFWFGVIADDFKPEKFDYCKIKCENYPGETHSACACGAKGGREEVLDDIVKFRQEILSTHNFLRNKVAAGEAVQENAVIVAASDMSALNYNLELEYIARCRAANSFNGGEHDKCRDTHDGKYVGQNLAGFSKKNLSATVGFVNDWYSEIKDMDNATLDNLQSTSSSKGIIGHFTQVVWAKTTHVGCARVWYPTATINFWLICNYGSTIGSAGNMMGEPVYQKGAACTKCPSGTKCEDEIYKSLCGKILAIPHDDPPKAAADPDTQPSAGERTRNNQIILFAAFTVLILFY